MSDRKMHLKIMIPEQIMEDLDVDKIVAEAPNGFFCLKPRHIDFTSALKPGILYYYVDEQEHIMAVNSGILVKCGYEVGVSVLNAMKGEELQSLEQRVHEEFIRVHQAEQSASSVLRKMETDLLERFISLEKDLGGR